MKPSRGLSNNAFSEQSPKEAISKRSVLPSWVGVLGGAGWRFLPFFLRRDYDWKVTVAFSSLSGQYKVQRSSGFEGNSLLFQDCFLASSPGLLVEAGMRTYQKCVTFYLRGCHLDYTFHRHGMPTHDYQWPATGSQRLDCCLCYCLNFEG